MTAEPHIDRIVEIEQLAALEQIDYDIVRIEAANRLGIRTSTLDRQVAKKRKALGLDTDDSPAQGRIVKINDVLPWYEPIEGDTIANVLAAAIKTYAVLPDVAADAIALWVLHSWTVNAFSISPRLAVTSPTKGCGKTTVLRFLNHVVRRPKRAGSISPPALFRVVEQFQPTILLDETEKYIEQGGDLHALLNEGHCKGATVVRVLGDKLELCEFAVYGAVAFARNGRLPDDLEQRSLIIEMQRRRPNEPLAELRDDRCESLQRTAKMCARWADDNANSLPDHDPDMGELINRDADNWRPLYAIADLIGSDWPDRIRQAAVALTPRDNESVGPTLLADIEAAFAGERKTDSEDRMASTHLCSALVEMEGHLWAEWKASKGAAPKPLSPSQLARLLRPFQIYPRTVRAGDITFRGYYRTQFEAAWSRYLPGRGVSEPTHQHNADISITYTPLQGVTDKSNVSVQNGDKPLKENNCVGVSVQKGENGPLAHNGAAREPISDIEAAYEELREQGFEPPRQCEHCGCPPSNERPLQECWISGEPPVWLHPQCQSPYFTQPKPVRSPPISAGPDDDLNDFKVGG